MPDFTDFYSGDLERCGFVLSNGEIIEVQNQCHEPSSGFEISPEDMLKYSDAVATWHTHPKATNVLSVDDYYGFRNWPDLKHYIIGENGVAAYIVSNQDVLIDE